ncbi:hypothetical protein KI387_020019, partial [Taxus chinensis]
MRKPSINTMANRHEKSAAIKLIGADQDNRRRPKKSAPTNPDAYKYANGKRKRFICNVTIDSNRARICDLNTMEASGSGQKRRRTRPG